MSVAAGDYDIVPARIYRLETVDTTGEVHTKWVYDRTRHIMVMAGTTREFVAQAQQGETSLNVFRIRRYRDTEVLDHTYMMEWRGRYYEFKGINYPNLEEIEVYAALTSDRPE